MSAVLLTPVNMEDLKAFIQSEIEKAVKPHSEKIDALEEENKRLRDSIEDLESQLCTIKGHLNLDDFFYDNLLAKGIAPFCDQMKQLSERLEQPFPKSIESTEIEVPVIPSTTLEHKACALVEHLKEKVKPRNNEVFLNSREIITVLKNEIPEDIRLKDIKNPRQAKKDIIEKAVKLFSDSVLIIRNKSGNKVTGIALKPSVKRRDTYAC